MADVARLSDRQAEPFTPPEERRYVTRLNQIPDAQLACRIHHKWPSEDLQYGQPMPEGLTATRTEKQGVFLIEDQCPRCGKVRWKLTKPRRVWDTSEGWHYIDPKNLPGFEDWVSLDKNMKRGARTMMSENIRRNAKALFK